MKKRVTSKQVLLIVMAAMVITVWLGKPSHAFDLFGVFKKKTEEPVTNPSPDASPKEKPESKKDDKPETRKDDDSTAKPKKDSSHKSKSAKVKSDDSASKAVVAQPDEKPENKKSDDTEPKAVVAQPDEKPENKKSDATTQGVGVGEPPKEKIAVFSGLLTENEESQPELNIGGLFQFQYSGTNSSSQSQNVSDMFVRRAVLSLSAKVSDNVDVVFEPEYGIGEGPLRNAYLKYSSSRFEVYAGNHIVPFSQEAMKDDGNLMFVERNLASQLAPNRNFGASAIGKMFDGRLRLQAGIWNSNYNANAQQKLINNVLADNRIFANNFAERGNNLFIEAARISWFSKGQDDAESHKLAAGLGAGFFSTKSTPLQNGITNTITSISSGFYSSSGTELDFFIGKPRRFTIEGEYATRNLDWYASSVIANTSQNVSSMQSSYSVQLSIGDTEKMYFTGRYEIFKYDPKSNTLTGADGQDSDKWQTLGINYKVKGQHLKIQANYIMKTETNAPGGNINNSTILIQTTVDF